MLLDENSEPFEDNKTSVRQFLTFFELAKRDYFGGRVLISESNITNEGKLYDENGNKMIPPSQLSVVADSAEVEVLIMNRSWMSLFPEEVQQELIDKIKYVKDVERPYSDRIMSEQKQKFTRWNLKR